MKKLFTTFQQSFTLDFNSKINTYPQLLLKKVLFNSP